MLRIFLIVDSDFFFPDMYLNLCATVIEAFNRVTFEFLIKLDTKIILVSHLKSSLDFVDFILFFLYIFEKNIYSFLFVPVLESARVVNFSCIWCALTFLVQFC